MTQPQYKPFSTKMFSLFAEEWYHGRISGSIAVALLQDSKDGSFLLRCSSRKGFYSLSFLKHYIVHLRVQVMNNGTLDMTFEGQSKIFEDEWEFIEHCKTRFELTVECPGSNLLKKFKKDQFLIRILNDRESPMIDPSEFKNLNQYPSTLLVYKAIWRGESVVLNEYPESPDNLKKIIYKLVKMPPHENLLEIKGLTCMREKMFIVSDPFEGYSIHDHLNRTGALSLELVLVITKGIAFGMHHLISQKIKGMNELNLTSKTVLLDKDTLKPKISDVAMLGIIGAEGTDNQNNIYRFGEILDQIVVRINLADYNSNEIRIMKLLAIRDKCLLKSVARPSLATILQTLDTL